MLLFLQMKMSKVSKVDKEENSEHQEDISFYCESDQALAQERWWTLHP